MRVVARASGTVQQALEQKARFTALNSDWKRCCVGIERLISLLCQHHDSRPPPSQRHRTDIASPQAYTVHTIVLPSSRRSLLCLSRGPCCHHAARRSLLSRRGAAEAERAPLTAALSTHRLLYGASRPHVHVESFRALSHGCSSVSAESAQSHCCSPPSWGVLMTRPIETEHETHSTAADSDERCLREARCVGTSRQGMKCACMCAGLCVAGMDCHSHRWNTAV